MSDKVGLIYVARGGDDFLGDGAFMPEMGREVSEELASIVDEETRRIIDECYQAAQETLQRERHRLEALAEALLQHESLDEKEILQVTGLAKRPDAEALLEPPDHTDTTNAEPNREHNPLAPDPSFAPTAATTNGAMTGNSARGNDGPGTNGAAHDQVGVQASEPAS
jgi:hypothetical protein